MLGTGFDPFDPEVLRDPGPRYAALRREAPVHRAAGHGYWIVSRYADVRAALRDHEAFSSAKGNAPEPGWQPGIIGKDPPDHSRLRNLTKSVFSPRAIERAWGDRIRARADELVTAALEAGTVDAYQAFSLPLPIQVIAEMIGVPDGDLATFKRWSDEMCEGHASHIDPAAKARSEAAFANLLGYFKAKVAERRAAPREDLVTLLCQAGEADRLTDKEVVHFLILLLIAGNETTTNLIGNGLVALLDHPEEEALLRARPELVPQAIEEMLRYCPPTQCVFRHTTRDVELAGVPIPADQRVMLCLASANRDEAEYAEPDRFRVERVIQEHLAFGTGIHSCLGVALARLEVRSILEALLRRTKGLRRAGEVRMFSTILVRGPIALPIELVT
jgi:cytochrome P450